MDRFSELQSKLKLFLLNPILLSFLNLFLPVLKKQFDTLPINFLYAFFKRFFHCLSNGFSHSWN